LLLPPAGAVAIAGSPGVIRSYPDSNQDRFPADPSTGPRDKPPSRQRPRPSREVQYSCAGGSWLYRV
jgi:hypothetical protein